MGIRSIRKKTTARTISPGKNFIFDYAAGWGLGNGWTVGAGGYYYQQTTDDQLNGANIPNSKGRAFAIGPSVKYDSGKGWFVTAKWQKKRWLSKTTLKAARSGLRLSSRCNSKRTSSCYRCGLLRNLS
ncbi:transporter [Undibacterium arcticum]